MNLIHEIKSDLIMKIEKKRTLPTICGELRTIKKNIVEYMKMKSKKCGIQNHAKKMYY